MWQRGEKTKKGVEQWLELGLRMVNIIIINHLRSSFTRTSLETGTGSMKEAAKGERQEEPGKGGKSKKERSRPESEHTPHRHSALVILVFKAQVSIFLLHPPSL